MKKLFAILILATSLSAVSAQANTCLSLTTNLQKGAESKNVLALQNFLFARGILKVMPNGYFGPSTLAAVKAYQKSKGFAQVGNTGPMTRAAIKKDSCVADSFLGMPIYSPPVTSTPLATTTAPATPYQIVAPVLDSIDPITLFSGGQTDWTFDLHGSHFAATGNSIRFKNLSTGRTYYPGLFSSSDGKTITIPKNFSGTAINCGGDCKEVLPPGSYEVTTTNFPDGQSNALVISVKSFTMSVQNAAADNAIPAVATGAKLGTVTFSSSEATVLRGITYITGASTISASGIGNIVLKEETTQIPLMSSGNNTSLYPFQSMIVGAYADTNNTIPGTITSSFTIEIEDYIGKKRTKFTSPTFLATVAANL